VERRFCSDQADVLFVFSAHDKVRAMLVRLGLWGSMGGLVYATSLGCERNDGAGPSADSPRPSAEAEPISPQVAPAAEEAETKTETDAEAEPDSRAAGTEAECTLVKEITTRSSTFDVTIERGEEELKLSGWHFKEPRPYLLSVAGGVAKTISRQDAEEILPCAESAWASSDKNDSPSLWLDVLRDIASGKQANPRK
jgi:hypothetical protein